MVSSQIPQPATYTNRTNIAMDGVMTMDALSHFEFFTRALLLLVIFLLHQLPASYAVHIDSKQFLDSMSMGTGEHAIRGRSWRLAPNGRLSDIDSERATDARARARDQFVNEWYPHVARGIPSVPNIFPVPGVARSGRPRAMKPQKGTKRSHRNEERLAPAKSEYPRNMLRGITKLMLI